MNAKMKKGLAVLLALIMAVIPMANFGSVTVLAATVNDSETFKIVSVEANDDGTFTVVRENVNSASDVRVENNVAATRTETFEANCQRNGGTRYIFEYIKGGESLQEIIEVEDPEQKKTPHNRSLVRRLQDSKCETPGLVLYVCTDCGFREIQETDELGHDEVVLGYRVDPVAGNLNFTDDDFFYGLPTAENLIDNEKDGYYLVYWTCKNAAKDLCDVTPTTSYNGVTCNVKKVPVYHTRENQDYQRALHTDNVKTDNVYVYGDKPNAPVGTGVTTSFPQYKYSFDKDGKATTIKDWDPDFVYVADCSKPAQYVVATYTHYGTGRNYSDDEVVASRLVTREANEHSHVYNYHEEKIASASDAAGNVYYYDANRSANVRYEYTGTNRYGLATYKLVNDSCATEGWAIVQCDFCRKEFKVTVPANPNHMPATEKKYDKTTDTATCLEDGTIDVVTTCEICGVELDRETVTSYAKGHAYAVLRKNVNKHDGSWGYHVVEEYNDPRLKKRGDETGDYINEDDKLVRTYRVVEEATQHYAGTAVSEALCLRCGEALEGATLTHTLDPLDPNRFDYEYKPEWGNVEATVDFVESDDHLVAHKHLDAANPAFTLYGVPKDEDIVAKGETAKFTETLSKIDVKFSYETTEEGTPCTYAKRVYTATVTRIDAKGTVNDRDFREEPLVFTSPEYYYRQADYKGHKWSTPFEGEDGNTHVICDVCGEDEIIHYGDGTTGDVEVEVTDLAFAKIEGKVRDYTGKKEAVPFTVWLNNKQLEEGKDYVLSRENAFQNGGNHPMTITGIGDYTGEQKFDLTIIRKEQKLQIKTANETEALTVNTADLEDGDQIFWIKVAGVKSKVEKVKVTSNSKYVTVTPAKTKAGYYKVTVSKGVKANGTYRITATAPKTNSYAAGKVSTLITVK